MTTAFAADGRLVLPPFFPIGRGEDAIWGQLLSIVFPTGCFAHLPWAILHRPWDTRRFWPGEVLRSAATADIPEAVCSLMADCHPGPASQDSLQAVGRHLSDLATRNLGEFIAYLREKKQAGSRRKIAFLQTRLGWPSLPESCRRDLRRYIEILTERQNDIMATIPAELLYGRDPLTAAELFQSLIGHYGRLLHSWSELLAFLTKSEAVAEVFGAQGPGGAG